MKRLAFLLLACGGTPAGFAGAPLAAGFVVDGETASGPQHLVNDFAAIEGELVNAVIEIPTGTDAKVEVDHMSGALRWTRRNGELRRSAVAYPGNYGLIPRTLSPRTSGGDGDPLDVLVMGPAVARGTVMRVRPVALLRLFDEGEEDFKVVAVPEGARQEFDRAAIERFFQDYDAEEEARIEGWSDPWPAIRAAAAAYEAPHALL